jgi:hypothetical protein
MRNAIAGGLKDSHMTATMKTFIACYTISLHPPPLHIGRSSLAMPRLALGVRLDQTLYQRVQGGGYMAAYHSSSEWMLRARAHSLL